MRICEAFLPLAEGELAQVHGGMFAAHMNPKGSTVMKAPSAQPSPFSGQAMLGAMVQGAVVGGGTGARTGGPGAAATGAVGGALLGGMGNCASQMVTQIQVAAPPTNVNAYTKRGVNPFRVSTMPWKA